MSRLTATIDAVMAALAGAAPVVDRVRLRPQAASVNSAVVVRPGEAQAPEVDMHPGLPVSWFQTVEVECYARVAPGTAPDLAVDPLLSDVYARLTTDPTLGGAVYGVTPVRVTYDFDADGDKTACATLTLSINQRSLGATL